MREEIRARFDGIGEFDVFGGVNGGNVGSGSIKGMMGAKHRRVWVQSTRSLFSITEANQIINPCQTDLKVELITKEVIKVYDMVRKIVG